MGLEAANYISELVETNPTGSDPASSSDDHHRLIKKTLRQSFPNVSGPVTATHLQMSGVSPVFTGTPTAPTPAPTDPADRVATMGAIAYAAPTGACMMHAGVNPPAGWLKRNGAAVSRTTYAALYLVIGATYGAGDGSTTFNLPDSRGAFDRGWDDGRGLDPGRPFGSGQSGQNQSHLHTGSTNFDGNHQHVITGAQQINGAGGAVSRMADLTGTFLTDFGNGAHSHAFTTALSGGNESRPVNVAFLPCIKY